MDDIEKRFNQFWMENEKITGSSVSCTFEDILSFIQSEIRKAKEEERANIRARIADANLDGQHEDVWKYHDIVLKKIELK